MDKPEYLWIGDWSAPKHGKYVILKNGEEMEPGDVIELLDDFQDLIEQLSKEPLKFSHTDQKKKETTIQELKKLTEGK